MSALGRLFARLFGRRRATRPAPFAFDAAPTSLTQPAPEASGLVEPRSELAVTPALGAASGEAEVIAATAGVELVGEDAPTVESGGVPGADPVADSGADPAPESGADEEDVFEEEERAEDAAPDAAGLDLDVKIAARAAAVPYLRQVAEEEALSGEHRIRPTDPSGPGTLAEALARLEGEGRLVCDLGEDEDGAPLLVYRPRPSVH